MHVAVSEFARHVAGMEGPTRPRWTWRRIPRDRSAPEQKEIADMADDAARRRSGQAPRLDSDPRAVREAVVYERHRHRYEVNNHLGGASSPPASSARAPPRRAARGGDRARGGRPSVLHRLAVPPEFSRAPSGLRPLFREFVGAALAHAEQTPDEPERLARV